MLLSLPRLPQQAFSTCAGESQQAAKPERPVLQSLLLLLQAPRVVKCATILLRTSDNAQVVSGDLVGSRKSLVPSVPSQWDPAGWAGGSNG